MPTGVTRLPGTKPAVATEPSSLNEALQRAQRLLLKHQFNAGYWWYTLEANETIGAEYVMLTHLLGKVDATIQSGLCQRMLREQRSDGSWGIYYLAPGDLSTTVECYMALRLAGLKPEHDALKRARKFILKHGGLTKVRVFTRIHLALFDIIPWQACPAMPPFLMLLPPWLPINIYEFSSWARATIVPLLVVLHYKPTKRGVLNIDELFVELPSERDFRFKTKRGLFSFENFTIQLDKVFKWLDPLAKFNPINFLALKKCQKYIESHIAKTEDIFPALNYAALSFHAMGYGADHPVIRKSLNALKTFQQVCKKDLASVPKSLIHHEVTALAELEFIHQQCCISPVWDTPWAALALLDSGVASDAPEILKTGRYLLTKQITQTRGDWAKKNRFAKPGGWAFEFENDYFPDVDDTIAVLTLLFKCDLPNRELMDGFQWGLNWLKSMQSANGGWAAFDVNNSKEWVNRIPFSDHGACLDPPTPDITGRALELFGLLGEDKNTPFIKKAVQFIFNTQDKTGAWWGRWGINYVYGTWCVLTGLAAIGFDMKDMRIQQAVRWLKSTQHGDGGWGESPEGYKKHRYIPWHRSVPSQTAWALMGLMAAGEGDSSEVKAGIEFLLRNQTASGEWPEPEFTGTGFPGHFYIRYHGYRHFFPLMALGKYRKNT